MKQYHNGNYCYSDKTKMVVSMSGGDDGRVYLIDITKLEKQDEEEKCYVAE